MYLGQQNLKTPVHSLNAIYISLYSSILFKIPVENWYPAIVMLGAFGMLSVR